MTALPPEVRRAAEPVGVGGFEIGYVTDDGLEHRVSLSQAWATPFESCSPIRRFTSHKGQRHLSGLWWSATTGGHVGFESWMERDHVMALDFDPTVVGIASQPFWLSWRDRAAYDDGRRGYHADLPLVSTPIIRKVISTSRLLVQLNRNQVSASSSRRAPRRRRSAPPGCSRRSIPKPSASPV